MNATDNRSMDIDCVRVSLLISTNYSLVFSPFVRIAFITLFVLIGFTAVVGNLFILLVFCTSREIHKSSFNILIFNRAVVDILIGCYAVPIFILQMVTVAPIRTIFTINYYCTFVLHYMNILITIQLTLDRFRLVNEPIKYSIHKYRKKTLLYSIITWLLSIILVLSDFVLYNTAKFYSTRCAEHLLGTVIGFVTIIVNCVLPFITLVISNLVVFVKLKRKLDKFKRNRNSRNHTGDTTTCVPTEDDEQTTSSLAGNVMHGSLKDCEVINLPNGPTTSNNIFDGKRSTGRENTSKLSNNVRAISVSTTLNHLSKNNAFVNSQDPSRSHIQTDSKPKSIASWQGNSFQSTENPRIRARKLAKAGRQLFLIVVIFVICWLPFWIVLVIADLRGYNYNGLEGILYAVEALLFAKASINPFLYILTNKRIRRHAKLLLCSSFFRRRDNTTGNKTTD